MTPTTTYRLGLALLLVALAALALGWGNGARPFRADTSLHITNPTPLSVESVPFTVSWRSGKINGLGYAVFVDLPAISPGVSLSSPSCKGAPTCGPNSQFLATVGIYLTTTDSVTVPVLPALAGMSGHQKHPLHTLTIVRVDRSGRRVGSGAWQVEFRA